MKILVWIRIAKISDLFNTNVYSTERALSSSTSNTPVLTNVAF